MGQAGAPGVEFADPVAGCVRRGGFGAGEGVAGCVELGLGLGLGLLVGVVGAGASEFVGFCVGLGLLLGGFVGGGGLGRLGLGGTVCLAGLLGGEGCCLGECGVGGRALLMAGQVDAGPGCRTRSTDPGGQAAGVGTVGGIVLGRSGQFGRHGAEQGGVELPVLKAGSKLRFGLLAVAGGLAGGVMAGVFVVLGVAGFACRDVFEVLGMVMAVQYLFDVPDPVAAVLRPGQRMGAQPFDVHARLGAGAGRGQDLGSGKEVFQRCFGAQVGDAGAQFVREPGELLLGSLDIRDAAVGFLLRFAGVRVGRIGPLRGGLGFGSEVAGALFLVRQVRSGVVAQQ